MICKNRITYLVTTTFKNIVTKKHLIMH